MGPGDHAASQPPQVWACVVCYHPQPQAVAGLVAALAPQVERVLVIDNSPGRPALDPGQLRPAQYVAMNRNAGTAGAMNEAWRIALAAGATHMVSFDQDSHPGPDLVRCLLAAFDQGAALAAVGPVWSDARSGKPMRLLLPVGFLRRHAAPPAAGIVEVDHVITSGCMISARAYRAVGAFDEDLFLDYVDVEWSLRARARGYVTAIAAGCGMAHEIGERRIAFAGRQLAVHKPQRAYLQLRNHLLMWRNPAIRASWLLSDLVQVGLKQSALVLLAPQRLARLRSLGKAFADGLRGRGGAPAPSGQADGT